MSKQRSSWDYEEHLGAILSKGDDPLEKLSATVDFERFRPILETAAGRPRGAKGGRPALDVVLKFKLNETVPDANTLWDFREAPVKAGVLDELFEEMNRIIAEAGFISRSGQIVDSSLVAAPARDRRGEGGGQGGPVGGRDLAGRAGQGVAEGHGRALDGQAQEGEGQAGRQEAGRHRHSGLRLQDPHQHRQEARDHPPPDRDGRRRERRQAASRRADRPRQHLRRCVGGHGVPLGGEREVAEGERAGQPHPPQEAARPPDARADREGQRAQVEGPGEGRARLRPPEGPDGAGDPDRRAGPRQGRRHDGEHHVQHGPIAMASRSSQTAAQWLGVRLRPEAGRRGRNRPASDIGNPEIRAKSGRIRS